MRKPQDSQCRSLVWLRRDLRLHDHRCLAQALEHAGSVCLAFVFDTEILQRFNNPRDRRLTFLVERLLHLEQELRARGGGLLLLHGKAEELIPRVAAKLELERVIAGRDYEPATQARDAKVKATLQDLGIDMLQPMDHLLMPAEQVLKADGTPYRVFTPYSKLWRSSLRASDFREAEVNDSGRHADVEAIRAVLLNANLPLLELDKGAEHILQQIGYEIADLEMWDVTRGPELLHDFVQSKIGGYSEERNFMAKPGTSRLSPYLRFGCVSIRELYRAAQSVGYDGVWVSELIWREFYTMILHYFPESATQEFNVKYRTTLEWNKNEEHFSRFAEGKTGVPIVDAAIRELLTTGWMHNRARMIVASYLTKDLFIDWRRGEELFAQHLMDYELASNVGGWQWAASTGTDAAPYFRVFNPWRQGQKFDAEGEYIRHFVPELRDRPLKQLHTPPAEDLFAATGKGKYPAPLVEHAAAKKRAIAAFKTAQERFEQRDSA